MKVKLQPLGDWACSFELILLLNVLLVVMAEALPPIPTQLQQVNTVLLPLKLKNCKFGSVFYQS